MAAVVYLDAKMDMKTTFTYQASDGTGKDASGVAYGFNNLTLRVGDVVQHRDLFYATLVGSANNGATALVRAAGLTRAEFVARMNAKAKAWGMTDTTFVEPSGLDPANISTAKDVAIMASKAFNGYEPIRYVTTKSSYTFVASKSGRHTVKTTDTLLTRNNGLTVTGGKTGYIDEAQYTYAVRLKNAQGAQIIISLLGSPSSATRFSEAALLANWAWKNYRWV
jgi:D-alanyl-D-alanine endopeptidase (penicillin-binding protein 7)